jgi:hypothetical protein
MQSSPASLFTPFLSDNVLFVHFQDFSHAKSLPTCLCIYLLLILPDSAETKYLDSRFVQGKYLTRTRFLICIVCILTLLGNSVVLPSFFYIALVEFTGSLLTLLFPLLHVCFSALHNRVATTNGHGCHNSLGRTAQLIVPGQMRVHDE